MQKLSIETHGNAIRFYIDMLESEIKRLTQQVNDLKTVNKNLKKNLKAYTASAVAHGEGNNG